MIYVFIFFVSSRPKCNIVSLLCCFRKKSRILIYAWAFMIDDSNIKHKNNPQQATSILFFLYFFFPTFPTHEMKKLLIMLCIIETENTESKTFLIARDWRIINQRSNVTQSRPGSSEGLELLMIKSVQYQSESNLSK